MELNEEIDALINNYSYAAKFQNEAEMDIIMNALCGAVKSFCYQHGVSNPGKYVEHVFAVVGNRNFPDNPVFCKRLTEIGVLHFEGKFEGR